VVQVGDALVEESLSRFQVLVREPELRNPHGHVRVGRIDLTHVRGHALEVTVLQIMLACRKQRHRCLLNFVPSE
jgi:hypothetical protein